MENASKALLIAASILIAIALIALGVNIFDQSSEPTQELKGSMDTTAIATFNNKFLIYSGNQSGSRLKALANVVIAHNATAEDSKKVKFGGETTGTKIIEKIAGIDNMTIYAVTIIDNTGDGYIDAITYQ